MEAEDRAAIQQVFLSRRVQPEVCFRRAVRIQRYSNRRGRKAGKLKRCRPNGMVERRPRRLIDLGYVRDPCGALEGVYIRHMRMFVGSLIQRYIDVVCRSKHRVENDEA